MADDKKYEKFAKAIKDLPVSTLTKQRIAQHSASALIQEDRAGFNHGEFFETAEVAPGEYDSGTGA